jgi:hypothetical protein
LVRTEAALANPIATYKIFIGIDFYEATLQGNHAKIVETTWRMAKLCVDSCTSETLKLSDQSRMVCKVLALCHVTSFDFYIKHVGVDAVDALFGQDGHVLLDLAKACTYDLLHAPIVDVYSFDVYFSRGGAMCMVLRFEPHCTLGGAV